jgi:hypothetical protein
MIFFQLTDISIQSYWVFPRLFLEIEIVLRYLKMIKVHFEITACNDWQNANSEFLWATSTLSAMWVEKVQGLKHNSWICPQMFATEIVFIPILRHSPCKCSAIRVIALWNEFFSTIFWKKREEKCTLFIFNKHAISFVQFFSNGPLFL